MSSINNTPEPKKILLFNIVSLCIIFFLHCYIYKNFIAPHWEYQNFVLEIDYNRLPAAFITAIVFSLILPKKFENSSDLYILLVAVMYVTACSALYVYAGISLLVFFSTFLSCFLVASIRFIKLPNISRPKLSKNFLLFSILLFVTLVAIRVIILQGVTVSSIDLLDVAERRMSARETLIGIDGYLRSYGQQLSVIGFVLSLYYRKLLFSFYFMAIVLVFFTFIGQKSFIFIAIASFVIFFLFKSRIKLFVILILISMSIFLLIPYDSQFGIYYSSIVFRRISYVPTLLNDAYLSYYSENGFIYWGYSTIGLGIVPYSDELSPALRIGEVLFPGRMTHANTGIIGSGFMNAGYTGIAIYALVLGLVCAFLDRLGRQSGNQMLISALCAPQLFLATTTSDLPGMILSGGLGSVIIVSLLIPDASKIDTAQRIEVKRKPIIQANLK